VKKLLLAVSALALSAASASAADLAARPYVKAPPLPMVYDWSGFYIGVNGGYGWAHDCFADAVSGFTDNCHGSNGGIAGGQLGWRTQTGSLVWGVDFQGGWADLHGSNLGAFNPATTFSSKTNGLASFAMEAGYAVNNVLLYARGGAGWTSNTFSATTAGVATSLYEARWGGLLGAGLEYGITPNWTVGVEYNHYFLGAVTDAITATGERVSQNGLDTITAKINYKFGGPIVARY
jgi:outer membrane immunogenic protein